MLRLCLKSLPSFGYKRLLCDILEPGNGFCCYQNITFACTYRGYFYRFKSTRPDFFKSLSETVKKKDGNVKLTDAKSIKFEEDKKLLSKNKSDGHLNLGNKNHNVKGGGVNNNNNKNEWKKVEKHREKVSKKIDNNPFLAEDLFVNFQELLTLPPRNLFKNDGKLNAKKNTGKEAVVKVKKKIPVKKLKYTVKPLAKNKKDPKIYENLSYLLKEAEPECDFLDLQSGKKRILIGGMRDFSHGGSKGKLQQSRTMASSADRGGGIYKKSPRKKVERLEKRLLLETPKIKAIKNRLSKMDRYWLIAAKKKRESKIPEAIMILRDRIRQQIEASKTFKYPMVMADESVKFAMAAGEDGMGSDGVGRKESTGGRGEVIQEAPGRGESASAERESRSESMPGWSWKGEKMPEGPEIVRRNDLTARGVLERVKIMNRKLKDTPYIPPVAPKKKMEPRKSSGGKFYLKKIHKKKVEKVPEKPKVEEKPAKLYSEKIREKIMELEEKYRAQTVENLQEKVREVESPPIVEQEAEVVNEQVIADEKPAEVTAEAAKVEEVVKEEEKVDPPIAQGVIHLADQAKPKQKFPFYSHRIPVPLRSPHPYGIRPYAPSEEPPQEIRSGITLSSVMEGFNLNSDVQRIILKAKAKAMGVQNPLEETPPPVKKDKKIEVVRKSTFFSPKPSKKKSAKAKESIMSVDKADAEKSVEVAQQTKVPVRIPEPVIQNPEPFETTPTQEETARRIRKWFLYGRTGEDPKSVVVEKKSNDVEINKTSGKESPLPTSEKIHPKDSLKGYKKEEIKVKKGLREKEKVLDPRSEARAPKKILSQKKIPHVDEMGEGKKAEEVSEIVDEPQKKILAKPTGFRTPPPGNIPYQPGINRTPQKVPDMPRERETPQKISDPPSESEKKISDPPSEPKSPQKISDPPSGPKSPQKISDTPESSQEISEKITEAGEILDQPKGPPEISLAPGFRSTPPPEKVPNQPRPPEEVQERKEDPQETSEEVSDLQEILDGLNEPKAPPKISVAPGFRSTPPPEKLPDQPRPPEKVPDRKEDPKTPQEVSDPQEILEPKAPPQISVAPGFRSTPPPPRAPNQPRAPRKIPDKPKGPKTRQKISDPPSEPTRSPQKISDPPSEPKPVEKISDPPSEPTSPQIISEPPGEPKEKIFDPGTPQKISDQPNKPRTPHTISDPSKDGRQTISDSLGEPRVPPKISDSPNERKTSKKVSDPLSEPRVPPKISGHKRPGPQKIPDALVEPKKLQKFSDPPSDYRVWVPSDESFKKKLAEKEAKVAKKPEAKRSEVRVSKKIELTARKETIQVPAKPDMKIARKPVMVTKTKLEPAKKAVLAEIPHRKELARAKQLKEVEAAKMENAEHGKTTVLKEPARKEKVLFAKSRESAKPVRRIEHKAEIKRLDEVDAGNSRKATKTESAVKIVKPAEFLTPEKRIEHKAEIKRLDELDAGSSGKAKTESGVKLAKPTEFSTPEKRIEHKAEIKRFDELDAGNSGKPKTESAVRIAKPKEFLTPEKKIEHYLEEERMNIQNLRLSNSENVPKAKAEVRIESASEIQAKEDLLKANLDFPLGEEMIKPEEKDLPYPKPVLAEPVKIHEIITSPPPEIAKSFKKDTVEVENEPEVLKGAINIKLKPLSEIERLTKTPGNLEKVEDGKRSPFASSSGIDEFEKIISKKIETIPCVKPKLPPYYYTPYSSSTVEPEEELPNKKKDKTDEK